jgi:prophage regulatory protein
MVKNAAASPTHSRQNGRDQSVLRDDTADPEAASQSRMGGDMRMLRLAQVIEKTQLRKTTIYKLQKLGRFPKSVPLTGHSVRWVESEVEDWLASRKRARDRAINSE